MIHLLVKVFIDSYKVKFVFLYGMEFLSAERNTLAIKFY